MVAALTSEEKSKGMLPGVERYIHEFRYQRFTKLVSKIDPKSTKLEPKSFKIGVRASLWKGLGGVLAGLGEVLPPSGPK